MPSAKKIISAEIHLSSVLQFNKQFQNKTSVTDQNDEITSFLREKYEKSETGEISFTVQDSIAKFRWTLPKVVSDAEILHKDALAQARSRKFKNAIEKWIKAISLNPIDPDYYFNAGIAFYEEKNYKEAIENLERTIQLCPIYFKARLILGTIYLKLRKFHEAEEHLKESIYFNPKNPLAILNLGAVYSILKKYEEGVNAFQKIIELAPKEPRAHFGLGKIYSIQGKTQEANDCFNKVIEYDEKGELANHAKRAIITDQSSTSIFKPKSDLPKVEESNLNDYYAEGYSAYLYGDYARASDLYRKYIEYRPKDDNVWFSLGEAYLRAGYPKEASASFNYAIKLRRKGLYYKQLAVAYDFLAMTEKAVESVKEAISLGKKDSIVYTVWGKNLIKQNNLKDAIEKLDLAQKTNKANLSAIYHLAVAHTKCHQINEAIDYLHIIMNSKVQSPIKKEAEELYAKISKR